MDPDRVDTIIEHLEGLRLKRPGTDAALSANDIVALAHAARVVLQAQPMLLELDAALTRLDLDLVCRAHKVVQDSYEFFANQGLVTV
ncbi:Aste57867_2233 [Aphanomyces stellatus]|uniref:protein-serine/threonine phosphatase n=1 Tax=Aphanomyces stellatus TaxID=120398 RepID=A0A485KCS0_9STRA|nr:hypothetical protein As57867_002228 [Aphanomyces stellatus]VFT79436.1 Aste57867_2233 [Aphanomyces stellatus]